MTGKIVHATDRTWALVEATKGIVVIDFWKDDCQPCAKLAPIIDGIAEQFPEVTIVKTNVAEAPAAAARFGVTSFPMVYILKDGVRQTFFGGWMPQNVIADMIRDIK